MDGVEPSDAWSLVSGKNGAEYRLDRPVEIAPVNAEPAPIAYQRVLNEAGASLVRDAVDRRIVKSVRERTGGLIDSQEDVGGWPRLASKPNPQDTDRDGMPDQWELAHRLDPKRADDKEDANSNGYTNIEQYLNRRPGAVHSSGDLTH